MFGIFGKKKKKEEKNRKEKEADIAESEIEIDEYVEDVDDEYCEEEEEYVEELVDELVEIEELEEETKIYQHENSNRDEEIKQEVNQKTKKQGFFAKLSQGLKKTRDNIGQAFDSVFSHSEIDEDFYDELEEALIMADVGMTTTMDIVDRLKTKISEDKIKEMSEARSELKKILADIMAPETEFIFSDEKAVILVVGVNGVGKTTTIGKLAHKYKEEGRSVLLAAADTFRAAATEQLVEWSERADVPIIKYGEGADPAAVVYDAIQSGKARDTDIIIVDTAGRLHNKKHLMLELTKIRKIIDREYPGVRVETLLVLDATTGQNGLEQAKMFAAAVDVSGIILSKLDGTAKGGVVLAIKHDAEIPVRFIGVGEKIDDLQDFEPSTFVDALF